MKIIKIIILCLLIFAIVGCSDRKMDTVDLNFESSPEAKPPTISNEVIVHTVVGEAKGKIVAEDNAIKWVQTNIAHVSQHPFALIETSLAKVFKAEVVSFDEENGVAYLRFKNATKLTDPLKEKVPKGLNEPVSFKERLAIKDKFADTFSYSIKPSEKINHFEDALFTQNPDEIEAFIYQFEQALSEFKNGTDTERFKDFIANDALQSAFESLTDEAKREDYASIKVKTIQIGLYSTIASAALALSEEEDATIVKATYSIVEIDGQLQIINVQYE